MNSFVKALTGLATLALAINAGSAGALELNLQSGGAPKLKAKQVQLGIRAECREFGRAVSKSEPPGKRGSGFAFVKLDLKREFSEERCHQVWSLAKICRGSTR